MKAALSGPTADHWLGTDQLGRDQLSRLLYGGRTTMLVAGLGVGGVIAIGLIVGTIAGYFGGRIDLVISAVLNVLLSLPTLLLTLAILGILGPGTNSLMLAIIGAGWVGHARMFRSSILSLRQRPYIEAAHSMGASSSLILRRHLWPNLFTTIVVMATLDVGALILTISSLSFLGLGVQPPTADWGTMLNEARPFVGQVPLLAIVPGICISVVSLSSNMLGDAIRDVVDIGRRNR
jgi:peptide/nickel transport system permease protein